MPKWRRRGLDQPPPNGGMLYYPDQMRAHSAAYWQRVSDHIDPYSAIMVDRRASVTVNRPILGLDGDSAAIRMPEADEPLLALGVGGSGKTASVITVNALLSPGPLVSTSSRSDVYLAVETRHIVPLEGHAAAVIGVSRLMPRCLRS